MGAILRWLQMKRVERDKYKTKTDAHCCQNDQK